MLGNAAALAQDKNFRDRVTAAILGAARKVLTTPDVGLYEASYARALVQNPTRYVDAFAWAIATDPNVAALGPLGAAVPDEAIIASVQATWTVLAADPQPSSG